LSYAIDFGTSNTVVARWNAATQQPQTLSVGDLSVQLGENPALVPSLAYIQDARQGQVFVGQQVRDRRLDLNTDPRFFRSFKRGIGAAVQGFLPELDGQAMTFERVEHWFLRQLVQQLLKAMSCSWTGSNLPPFSRNTSFLNGWIKPCSSCCSRRGGRA